MQTFLPYPDVRRSLKCLNKQRLLKQAVEAKQLINILHNKKTGGWVNHPATRMYRNNVGFLINYYNTCLDLCKEAGINLTKLQKIEPLENQEPPFWFGDETFHLSHRANLWRKAFDDANGVKRDGLSKRASTSQFDTLVNEGVERPENFYQIDYCWPC